MSVDGQRTRVYEAEALVRRILDRSADYPIVEVAGSHLTLPPERKFASLESVQSYVDVVLGLGWVAARWSRASIPIRVRSRAGQSRAHYERPGVIAVPLHHNGRAWALREMVLLHEVAHHLGEDADEPAHGADFTGRMVDLVGGIVGAEAAFLLRVTLLESGATVG